MSETMGKTDRDKAIECSLEEARGKGLYVHAPLRPPIKLKADTPKIVIALPVGDKDDPDIFSCPECQTRSFGVVKCAQCGSVHSARQKIRGHGLVPIEWIISAWQMVPPLLCSMSIAIRKGVLSAQARNEITYEALKMGAKYIFYWDDDTLIPPKALLDMHNIMEQNEDIGILSGVYTTREECPEPLIFKNHGEGSYWHFSTKPGVTEPIFGAGAGCMMARVEMLVEMRDILGGEWWMDEHAKSDDGDVRKAMWGHDIRICKRVWETGLHEKASRPWSVHVAGWIQCGHFDIMRQRMFQMPKDAPCFKDANTQGYWNKTWYGELGSIRFYEKLYTRISRLMPKDARVADVGCGPGVLMEYLTKKNLVKCYGYDISDEAIKGLNMRWLDGEQCDVLNLDLIKCPINPNVAVATETLEHLSDDRLERVLTETAAYAAMSFFSVPEGELKGTPQGEHVQVFTVSTLRKKLKTYWPTVKIEKIDGRLLAVCTHTKDGKKCKATKSSGSGGAKRSRR